MQQFAYTKGKNATDSALIIDAMDLLYAGRLDGFVIVSSDSDFTRLASRLQESGMVVYGMGQRKTPASFVAACTQFIYLDLLLGSKPAPAKPSKLRRSLTAAIEAASRDDGWASLGAVGNVLRASDPAFDPREYGHGKLGDLVRDQTYLEVEALGSGQLRVRVK